jgi:Prealbumin-like fold domain
MIERTTQRILGPKGGERRRRFLFAPVLLIAALALILIASASGVLPGSPSKFESGNDPTLGLGNMVVDTVGNNDWKTVAFTHLTDAAAVTTDDSFSPGQKQDTTCPTVEGHKNPPKDDFTDVASFSEISASGEVFLYGATIRVAANGNASENIELKQGTAGLCPNSTLFARVPGDKLIAIDYKGGGSAVEFHVLTWVGSGACFVSNDVAPCWGATVVDLTGSGFAEGGVNNVDISAADNPISNTNIVAGQFAEFGVNLTGAGIIPPGTCSAFPQTVWQSRSSGSSFVSSTKDISIENKTISNCGTVVIIKRTDPRGVNQDFSFTSTLAGAQLSCSGDATPASFTLNDKAGVDSTGPPYPADGNVESCAKVPAGSYTVTEGADPTGFVLESLHCTVDGSGGSTGTQDGTNPKQANITLFAGDTVTCVYVDQQQLGAIKISKTSIKGPPLAGAQFSISRGGTPIPGSPFTTDANGQICVDHLAFGDYSVQETQAPPGYSIDDPTAHTVSVTQNSTCGDGQEATFAATNTPLTDIAASAHSQAPGGTQSTVTCVDSNNANVGNSPQGPAESPSVSATGLRPGTYVCTIFIDP